MTSPPPWVKSKSMRIEEPFLVFSAVTVALAAPAPMALQLDTESKVSVTRGTVSAFTQAETVRSRLVRRSLNKSIFIERRDGQRVGWNYEFKAHAERLGAVPGQVFQYFMTGKGMGSP
jgi:hypothetical protein